MSLRDLGYVGHMLDMARKAVDKTTGLSRGAYDNDENLRLALTHLVQVIDEAARHVSREFTAEHPEISWAEIVGMRHKVVHDYLGIDEDIVWQVVTDICRSWSRRSSHSFRRHLKQLPDQTVPVPPAATFSKLLTEGSDLRRTPVS